MEQKEEESVKLGANTFPEGQPLGTAAQGGDRDYSEPPPSPLFELEELTSWSFYRAGIAEFMATLLFLYILVMTCLGAICGAGIAKRLETRGRYEPLGGATNVVQPGYTKGVGLAAEIVGTFILAPVPIGFAVFVVHLATIPITGTGINPARSFGAAVIYNRSHAWHDHWIFWVGPFVGAALAALYHQVVIRAIPFKSK
ncbi:hypothetical protein RHGRI_007997 [Rhododendron griersonianum]|uniref:Uncharacterized protein n=1 Tax=Rhododendron griersonianum TaxID=479676 RepID=A0AAV6KYS5_9ERIC|nr:hypothetical protein RHGRI_007997 [Rhododendron griersonianum]